MPRLVTHTAKHPEWFYILQCLLSLHRGRWHPQHAVLASASPATGSRPAQLSVPRGTFVSTHLHCWELPHTVNAPACPPIPHICAPHHSQPPRNTWMVLQCQMSSKRLPSQGSRGRAQISAVTTVPSVSMETGTRKPPLLRNSSSFLK